jgi:hypothetical protein
MGIGVGREVGKAAIRQFLPQFHNFPAKWTVSGVLLVSGRMSRIPVTSLLLLVSAQAKGFKRGIGGSVWRPLCLEAANGARLMRRWEKMGDDGISTFRP